jgi:flagellar basal-body rod modification protein FlgD
MMSPILPTTASNSAFWKATDIDSRAPTRTLDQDDFIKLVVAQMSNQDPTKPQEDTEFIAQMTQFTALEQAKSMTSDISQIRTQQRLLQGMSLLDREVVVQSGKSEPITGVVKGLVMDGENPKILIGDTPFELSEIVNIRPATQN